VENSVMDQFLAWEAKFRPEIKFIGEMLAQKLSDDPNSLTNDLRDAESWYARAGYLLAHSNSTLAKFELSAMVPKEGRTEKDREVQLRADSAPIRLVRDILEHYCESIKSRLMTGMSLLAYYRQLSESKQGG